MTPVKRDTIDSFVIGTTQRGNETLVSLGELALAGNGNIPIVVTTPATTVLSPRQKPPNRVTVYPGGSDYWTQIKKSDMNTLLSIGTPITSEMAFLTMFSEWGTIEGGRMTGYGEYSSEQLYGKRRYPDELRMMSQEVEDVMVSHEKPLDVIRLRVPHCSMPAPEASQARITPAYHEDMGEAREFLRCALVARQRMGYFDCSTCPERLIFDYLWLDGGKFLADSSEPSNPFVGRWTYAESTEPEKWRNLTHVDIWSVAQVVQRKGVDAEYTLLEMAQRDSARRVWPVSMVRHPVPNVASSNAVEKVLNQYPWADSGLRWKGTMVFVEKPGEDRSTLFDSAKKPGVDPLRVGLPVLVRMLCHLQPLRLRQCPVLRQRHRQPERQPVLDGQRVSLLPQAREKGGSVPKASSPIIKGSIRFRDNRCQQRLRRKTLRPAAQTGKAPSGSTPLTSLPQSTTAPDRVYVSISNPQPRPSFRVRLHVRLLCRKPKAASEAGKAPSTTGAPSGVTSQSSVTASTGISYYSRVSGTEEESTFEGCTVIKVDFYTFVHRLRNLRLLPRKAHHQPHLKERLE